MRRSPRWPAFAASVALASVALALSPACRGCEGASGDAVAAIPSDLRIPVVVDGGRDAAGAASPAAIDAALLNGLKPDFIDGDRRAWRLKTLLGEAAARPHAVVEVEDEAGLRIAVLGGGDHEPGREAVLAVNRTGEVRVALIKPEEPFPTFHGRGGNRGRGGDPTRIREVRRIWIHLDPGIPAVDAGPG